MKILKRIVIAIVILAVILIGVGFAATKFINKEMVEKQISAATGREFKINGELQPVFSLTPSVRAEQVSLANAKWGSRPELATIGKFDIQLQLLPLLQNKIVVDKLDLDNADILLEQKDNRWNFAFNDNSTDKTADKEPSGERKKMSFNISALNITNTKLTIKQGGAPTVVDVKALKLVPNDKGVGLDFDGVVNNKPLKISVDLPPIGDLMSAKKFDVANLNVVSDDIKIKADAAVDGETQKVTINQLAVTKGDISVTGKGWADIKAKKAELVSFNVKKGDNISASGHVMADLNAKRVEITNLVGAQDGMKFTGAIAADISGKKPYVKGSINSDSITLKSSAKGEKTSGGSASTSSSKSSGDDALPLDALDSMDADLKISIGKLVSGDIVLDKVSAAIKINNGVLVVNPLSAGFANGQISTNLTLSKSGMRVNLKGSNLLMEKVLAQTVGYDDFKQGITNADVSLAGSGNSVNSIMASLSGTSKITMGKGTYSGDILKGKAAQLVTLLRGGNANKPIDINCTVADINWSNGTGSLQQMGVDTSDANLTGKGSIILPGHKLNLILTPVSKIAAVNSLAVPVKVGGTFENPKVEYGDIIKDVGVSAAKNIGTNYLQSLASGKKFKLNTKSALGIDKKATIVSPCGAAPVAAPGADTVPEVAPGTSTATPAETAPTQPLSKQDKKAQKRQKQIESIGNISKQFGL